MTERLAIDGGTPVVPKFIYFGRPAIGEGEVEEVAATLRSGWIGAGARTKRFEEELLRAAGASRGVALSSCTAALFLALELLGVHEGDEVITTPLTFAATANVVEHVRARLVLADVDEETFNVDPRAVAAAVTPRTRAVIPVHFAGLPCDLDALARAVPPGCPIVEDAAHALGASWRGRPIGSHGNLVAFSFYANKNLTTGEGGFLVVRTEEEETRLRRLALHGLNTDAHKRFTSQRLVLTDIVDAGWKANFTDLQAAMGLKQLERFAALQARRRALAARYDARFSGRKDVSLQRRGGEGEHALHLYLLRLREGALRVDRNRVVEALRAENIGAAIHYQPIHLSTYWRSRVAGAFPVAERVARSILTLPLNPDMSDGDADLVATAVEKVLDGYRA